MSLAKVLTRAIIGLSAPLVTIEAHISNGLPALILVGLPETSVKEAKERVRSAILNSGLEFPVRRITINLAPAELPKEGGRYDLPIAIAILAASGQVPAATLSQYEFLGELNLAGDLCRVKGCIPATIAAIHHHRQIILASQNSHEAALVTSDCALVAQSLLEVCRFLHEKHPLPHAILNLTAESDISSIPDLNEVIGQYQAKRALELAAAGEHHLLMIGPPGTGKTMLASRLPGILPPLTHAEMLSTVAISSLISSQALTFQSNNRPFRAPHHSASLHALVGGGSVPQPGEISLAHHGVLFLDELPEFNRRVLDALRQPLESGEICLSRAKARIVFPASFQLIAAMNPAPSGHITGIHHRNSNREINRYLNRVSGPLLDRFDLSLEIPLLTTGLLSKKQKSTDNTVENSAIIAARVVACRQRQIARQGKLNGRLQSAEITLYCTLEEKDSLWLESVLQKLGLSIRAWHKILKIARTIADHEGEIAIMRQHLQEALSYRAIDRLLNYLQQLSDNE